MRVLRSVPMVLLLGLFGCMLEPDNVPPSVHLTLPSSSTVYSQGAVVALAADATDPDDVVDRVEFYAGGILVGQDGTPPYEASWHTTGVSALRQAVVAVAYDTRGAQDTDRVGVEVRWRYAPPEATADGWETGAASEVGIAEERLEQMVNLLRDRVDHLIHGIVIVRHGRMVFEAYFPGRAHPTIGGYPVAFDRETVHVLSSVTKSFTATLFGIAIDQGIIGGVHEPVFEFFPEFEWLATGPKSAITLEHMLSMSSGLQWDQTSYELLDPRNDIAIFQRAPDPWEAYLARPALAPPGRSFLYSEASINVVGEVIRRASGMRLDVFADHWLFEPLGVNDAWWAVIRPELDFVWASGDLRLRPRDMAKLGQLYLDGGTWHGRRIVSSGWVDSAITPRFTFVGGLDTQYDRIGYAYGWWPCGGVWGDGAVAAAGWGHQWIAVMPEFDMVIVFTGGAYSRTPPVTFHSVMAEYIRPAIE